MAIRIRRKTDSLSAQLDKERRTVSFDQYDMNVKQLVDLVSTGAIDIAPEYQRKFVWQADRESTFIESVFLGIPIPSLFMATNKDSTWEVVDGVQRLSSLLHYCGEKNILKKIGREAHLELKGLEKLTTFDGYTFDDLPSSLQLAFQLRPIRVTTLNDKSDNKVRFDLFERLNTGGVRLQPQEIRNCIYRGAFNEKLKQLAKNPDFNKVVKVKSGHENNGSKEDLILRFFAFYHKYTEFNHSVNDFLNDFMGENSDKAPSKDDVKLFEQTFAFIARELPRGIVRGTKSTTTPVNLFEAVSVGTALAFSEHGKPKAGVLHATLDEARLKKLTTGGTNSRPMVTGRIEHVRDKLK